MCVASRPTMSIIESEIAMSITYRINQVLRALSLAPRPKTAAVLLSGGSGSRMKSELPKQWMELDEKPILLRTAEIFQNCSYIDEIVLVVRSGEEEASRRLLRDYGITKLTAVVSGGRSRQSSAYRGAKRVSKGMRYIAIHDVARPLVPPEKVEDVVALAHSYSAASLGHPVSDSIKRVGKGDFVAGHLDRADLWAATTPQVFSYPKYMAAAKTAIQNRYEVTDDNMLMEYIGQRVKMLYDGGENIKITTPADLLAAEAILKKRKGDAAL